MQTIYTMTQTSQKDPHHSDMLGRLQTVINRMEGLSKDLRHTISFTNQRDKDENARRATFIESISTIATILQQHITNETHTS